MTQAGITGNNTAYAVIEGTYGTYLDPSNAGGAWFPFIDESLAYNEVKYYSPQIRHTTIESEVKPGPYHVIGDIKVEVDCNQFPLFLYASRHTVVKTGPVSSVYTYTVTPSAVGSTYPGGSAKGLSVTVIRNGVGFGYSGCVVSQYIFAVENGVLMCTMSLIGLAEQDPSALGTDSYVAASIFGQDAHNVSVDASGTAPAFASADGTFNGFTATINYNAAAQNRIRLDRSASFISYGQTDYSYNTELDFLDKTEYTNFKNSTTRAIQFMSIKPGGSGGTWTAATEGIRLTFRRSTYDPYSITSSGGLGNLIMATVTGHGLGIAGAAAFTIECKSLATF